MEIFITCICLKVSKNGSLGYVISDRSRRLARLRKIIVEKRKFSAQMIAWLCDKILWFSINELISTRNMLMHVRLHHVASENLKKPGEKWSMRSRETIKIHLNFDETGRDLIVLRFAKFRHIWKSRPRRAYISNFIQIGQCAHLLPCVHLLTLFH